MKQYKKLQIIKHALQLYIKRPGAIEKDIIVEKQVLQEVTNEVEFIKEKYGIK